MRYMRKWQKFTRNNNGNEWENEEMWDKPGCGVEKISSIYSKHINIEKWVKNIALCFFIYQQFPPAKMNSRNVFWIEGIPVKGK